MKQYLLDLKNLESFDADDYIITESNIHALKWIDQWPNWGNAKYSNITSILGEEGSGKTHLAQIWAQRSGAIILEPSNLSTKQYAENTAKCYILEDLQNALSNEVELFYLLEHIIHNNKYLLITTNTPIHHLEIKLPDLKSRLNSIFLIEIKKPDEKMIEQILVKFFSDRQISISSNVIKYLLTRVNYNYKNIAEIVEKLDLLSLEAQKNISIPFIKEHLHL